MFLIDAERALYRDWDSTTQRFVAVVGDAVGRGATGPDFATLLHELSTRSVRFRDLWARHDVVARYTEVATFRPPLVGELQLHLERLGIPGVTGQSLIFYHPRPDPGRRTPGRSPPRPEEHDGMTRSERQAFRSAARRDPHSSC